ncbi:MAG: serine/threonine protein kinase, partial [Deltaproteobacteria bacterium]|nr:serine/threonine protein kinase [Deltaproteobacteria bacterium]
MFTELPTSEPGLPDERSGDRGRLPPGTLAGPWRVEHELGHGGMGTVYAVTHETIEKRAALKVVHPHALTPWFTAERFLAEAHVVNQVAHSGIVDIFETGRLPDGRPYLVMERLEGETLGQRVAKGRLAPEEVCEILHEVCAAIGAAHRAHIVHRDLKLDNIFLVEAHDEQRACIKVLDWGIAKVLSTDPLATCAERLTGTPRYVSPEQACGQTITVQSDVYSLGVVAYELFVGAAPFDADSAGQLLLMHARDVPAPPRAHWREIPPDLDALVISMLAKDPRQRPPIDQVAQRLAVIHARLRGQRRTQVRHGIAPMPRRAHGPRRVASAVSSTVLAPRVSRWTSPRLRFVRALALVALLGDVVLSAHARTAGADP